MEFKVTFFFYIYLSSYKKRHVLILRIYDVVYIWGIWERSMPLKYPAASMLRWEYGQWGLWLL